MSTVTNSAVIQSIQGHAIPVVGNDIDTDRILPARYMRCVTFDDLDGKAFIDDRAQAQGTHPFDVPSYQGASILVVNANFGCGSSREHAPQALSRWGIRAVVGESFAEIFYGNCLAMGVPCVTADPQVVQQLQTAIQSQPDQEVKIDLEQQQISWQQAQAPCQITEGARQMFLSGTWDTCTQLLGQAEAIRSTAAQLPYTRWSVLAG